LYNGIDLPEGYSRRPTAGAKKVMDKIDCIFKASI